MSGLEDEEQRVLRGARSAFAPGVADARRVLEATRAALAAGEGAPPTGAELNEVLRQASAANAAGTALRVWLARGGLLLSVAGLSGVVGYHMGLRAAHAPEPHIAQNQRQATGAPGTEPPQRAGSPRSVAEPPSRPPDAETQLDRIDADPALEPAARAPAGARAPSARTAHRPSGSRTSVTSEPTIEDELRGLRKVERALRDLQPQRALELLGELDRDVPNGKLDEERHAAFIMARCALGFGAADVLVREFSTRHPNSVYLARVRHSCPSDVQP